MLVSETQALVHVCSLSADSFCGQVGTLQERHLTSGVESKSTPMNCCVLSEEVKRSPQHTPGNNTKHKRLIIVKRQMICNSQ